MVVEMMEFSDYEQLKFKIEEVDISDSNLVAVIPSGGGNKYTINKVINDTFHSRYKNVIAVVDKLEISTYKSVEKLHENNSNLHLLTSLNGKGNAIRKGVEYILEERIPFGVISTIDADGETLPKDAITLADKIYSNCRSGDNIFGKGNRYYDNEPKSKITVVARELIKQNTDFDISDPRSGHNAITPKLAEKFVENELKCEKYGTELELLMLAYENGFKVLQEPVWYEPLNPRYDLDKLPIEDMLDYIHLFGEDEVKRSLKSLYGYPINNLEEFLRKNSTDSKYITISEIGGVNL